MDNICQGTGETISSDLNRSLGSWRFVNVLNEMKEQNCASMQVLISVLLARKLPLFFVTVEWNDSTSFRDCFGSI